MLSPFCKLKIKENDFICETENIISKLCGNKVVLIGVDKNFLKINKKFLFTKKLNISAIIYDNNQKNKLKELKDFKPILESQLCNEQFDAILIVNEKSEEIAYNLKTNFCIDEQKIFSIFNESIKDEKVNINFLYKYKFHKTYPKLVKKLKNKKVILYGAGVFLETINKYFDLSKLNIIGVSDIKYSLINNNEKFLGYKTFNPAEINDINPDYVLISTKFYVKLFEHLHFNIIKSPTIKIKPLVKKGFFTILKEIIESN